jgi:hypothetical protein
MTTLPERAADTTAEQPWPVRLLSMKIGEYVEKMSTLWVEGQVVQLNRRPGARTAYLTLRDPDVDMSLSVSIHVNALDAMPTPLLEGARVVLQAKPTFWAQRGSLMLDARQIRPVGVGELLARLEYLKRHLAAGGAVRSRAQEAGCRSFPDASGWSLAGRARPSVTSSRTPAAAGPPWCSRSARSPSRGRIRGHRGVAALAELDAHSRGRRHRHRPWRRRGRGPPAVQQRDPPARRRRRRSPPWCPRSVTTSTPRCSTSSPTTARPRRPMPRRRRPGCRMPSVRRSPQGSRSWSPRAGGTAAPRTRAARRAAQPAGAHRQGRVRAQPALRGRCPARPQPAAGSRPSCTGPATTPRTCAPRCAPCRRSQRSTVATRSCSTPTARW